MNDIGASLQRDRSIPIVLSCRSSTRAGGRIRHLSRGSSIFWSRISCSRGLASRRIRRSDGMEVGPRSLRRSHCAITGPTMRWPAAAKRANLWPVTESSKSSTLLRLTRRITSSNHRVSTGLRNRSMAAPREVIRLAIKDSAAMVIVVHTHPSVTRRRPRGISRWHTIWTTRGNKLGNPFWIGRLVAGSYSVRVRCHRVALAKFCPIN